MGITINSIIELRKLLPNDQEFGAAVAKYISQISCCDDNRNHVYSVELNTSPYGWDVYETKCKVCRKIIKTEVK